MPDNRTRRISIDACTILQSFHAVSSWPTARLGCTDNSHVANQLIKHYQDEIIRSLLSQTTDVMGVDLSQEFNQFLVSRFEFMESSDEGRAELESLKNDVLAIPLSSSRIHSFRYRSPQYYGI